MEGSLRPGPAAAVEDRDVPSRLELGEVIMLKGDLGCSQCPNPDPP